jgi:hypothetical protein
VTGEKYVGCSINLATRVRDYFKQSSMNKTRLVNVSMKNTGIENFTLELYKIDVSSCQGSELELVRALEQYYIFTLNPALNTIKVAGGTNRLEMTDERRKLISKAKSKPFYVYNADKSELLYTAESASLFRQMIDVSMGTICSYQNSGKALYGKLD